MGKKVDTLINKLMASGLSKSASIATLKKQGTIKQSGKHLALGTKRKKK